MKFAIVAVALAVSAAAAPDPTALNPGAQRLLDAARVWITADYFHPFLLHEKIDWDTALTENLPKIRAAKNAVELAAAYNGLLAVLHDPASAASTALLDRLDESNAPQRSRYHHGLAREDGKSQLFFSGFLTRELAGPVARCTIDLEDGVHVTLRLSEAASNPIAARLPHRYLDEAYPSEEARLLAAFRLWGAVHYFFAYKDLVDEDWDAVIADYFPKFIAAHDAREYHLAVAELVSHLSDSNASAQSSVLAQYFGEASPLVRVRLIEKQPVITFVSPEAMQLGAKIGDVITKVDGERSDERVRREANYLSASTAPGLGDLTARVLLNGAKGANAELDVRRAGGAEAHLSLPRASHELFERATDHPTPPNVTYLDVNRLGTLPENFPPAKGKALIIDLRGNCRFDPYELAAAFPQGAGRQTSIVTGPVAAEPDLPSATHETATSSYFQVHRLSQHPTGKSSEALPIVLLIDERTSGPAEQAVLFLSAAAKVQLIGTASAGAPSIASAGRDPAPPNKRGTSADLGAGAGPPLGTGALLSSLDTTQFRIPGNLSIMFSGQDIRLPNGGQIQRQGITPVLTAPVTIAGVRAGRDQPLDVALAWIKEQTTSSRVVK